jgi:site-specific DNA-methyltransferase (adenine-specific)
LLEINKIYNMDCLEGLKLLDDNSVDSIVTDPPYELGFMGKKWDSTGIAYNVELWQEALRVLKPGGHLLAFGGTRTYHRMVCAIEDAGFEIRDCIQWLYGSGFPKSMDISKAIDKKAGAEREIVGKYIRPDGSTRCNIEKHEGNIFQCGSNDKNITAPTTPEAKQWDGWGTALKPANEPIVVARKPLSEKTIVDNVLKWGTGGINIDDCRVEYDMTDTNPATNPLYRKKNGYKTNYGIDSNPSAYTLKKQEGTMNINNQGRFPANVILDEEAGKILDEQSGIRPSGKGNGNAKVGVATNGQGVPPLRRGKLVPRNDTGGASRFFYCAKASKKERGEGNNHPTVKPLSLIKYLITLVTPPEGVCLDPFEGSGTHALACEELGFNYIGFELDKEYYEIAKNRINKHIIDNNLQNKYSLIT